MKHAFDHQVSYKAIYFRQHYFKKVQGIITSAMATK